MRIASVAAAALFLSACGGQERSVAPQSDLELQLAKAHAAAASSVDGKVTICHIPPGNPANAHEITVGEPAVRAHVERHGDVVGPCCELDDSCDGGGGGECVPFEGLCEADADCCPGEFPVFCIQGQCLTP